MLCTESSTLYRRKKTKEMWRGIAASVQIALEIKWPLYLQLQVSSREKSCALRRSHVTGEYRVDLVVAAGATG